MSSWQRAFVLHSRSYRETSLLMDFFVESRGHLTLVAKGIRRKRSPQKGILQPFTPLIIQYAGKGQIKTLRYVEAVSLTLPLTHTALYSAFYVNELLQRVLKPEMETSQLFSDYLVCLQALARPLANPEFILREFEWALLAHLGYKLDKLDCDGNGTALRDDIMYCYRTEQGFYETEFTNPYGFTGRQLRAFSERDFSDVAALRAAKRFTRQLLQPYIGNKPFKSRELFRRPILRYPVHQDNR